MDNNLDDLFDKIIDYYNQGKIRFIWRKNSIGIITEDINTRNQLDEKAIRDFVYDFTDALKSKVLKRNDYESYKKYHKYVDKILKIDDELESDIFVRSTSNSSICNFIDSEILTKRSENLEVKCYSALINLNLERPNMSQDILKQITLEMSEKDLKSFRNKLDNIIKNIDKLKNR